ncbi:MAG: ornithine carbamoyltransferase, partial [Acidimicrobiia bacterium]|nr:ornithine carbamoyltransferase [Acidimicrobiia bacterium]
MLGHLLRTADLSPGDLGLLLDLAAALKAEPRRESELLRDETVALYFSKPSSRTRISFGAAIGRLGARTEALGPAELQLGQRETIEDVARVISRYARALVVRTFADEEVARFAAA